MQRADIVARIERERIVAVIRLEEADKLREVIDALAAGTNEPICARIAISAFWRRKVDLPPIFGPVTSHSAPPERSVSLATNTWPVATWVPADVTTVLTV